MMKYVTTARALSVLKAQYILRRPRKVKGRKKKKTNLNININCYLSIHAINIDVNDVNRPGKVKTNCWHVFFFFLNSTSLLCVTYTYITIDYFFGFVWFRLCVCARVSFGNTLLLLHCHSTQTHTAPMQMLRYIHLHIYILKYIYSWCEFEK